MQIIDAHVHLGNRPYFDEAAALLGQQNGLAAVDEMFRQNQVMLAVAMGSGDPDLSSCLPDLGDMDFWRGSYPPFAAGCVGVSAELLQRKEANALETYVRAAACPRTVGFKLYPGYQPYYVSDPIFFPLYDLAAQLDLPVVIHTGDTANHRGLVKYSHPLTVDEAASAFPSTRFVIAHCGSPWIVDATEVARKNPNVSIDLSGLAEGRFTLAHFLDEYRGFADYLAMWLRCLGDFDRILYGSDWPLVAMEDYIPLIAHIVPQRHHDLVFYQNALATFPKLNALRTA